MTQKNNFLKANFVYLIILLGFISIRILSATNALNFMGKYSTYIINIVLQVGLLLLLPLFLYPKLKKQRFKANAKEFGFKKISITAILIAILLGLIIYILNIGVSSFFAFVLSILGYEKLTSTTITSYPFYMLIINLIFTAVLPAICEETTHRGMLLHGYKDLGVKKAILFSSLLFGLTHLNIEQFFYATLIGAYLGILTVLCSNIIPAMIVHFMNNAISVALSFFISTSAKFSSLYTKYMTNFLTGDFLITIIGLFLLISVLVLLLSFLTFKLVKRTSVADFNNLASELAKQKLRQELLQDIIEPQPQTQIVEHETIPIGVEHNNKHFKIYFPINEIGFPLKQKYYPNLKSKAIFYGCFTIGILITVFTFIWGIL